MHHGSKNISIKVFIFEHRNYKYLNRMRYPAFRKLFSVEFFFKENFFILH